MKDTRIELTVQRETAEGMPIEDYVAAAEVSAAASFIAFEIPLEKFFPIANGQARLSYTVADASSSVRRSKSLPLKILGQAMELPLPRVPVAEQNNGVLDPASGNVRVEVPPYYFMSEGNDVHMYWMGKTESGANVMHSELKTVASGDVGSAIDFFIPNDKVSVLAGGSVEVYYTVNTFGRAFFKSPSLFLAVSNDHSAPLPLPTILEAENDILDPAKTANGATVVIAASAGLRVGDHVKVSWSGPKGSDGKEKVIGAADAGNALSLVFSSVLVSANDGQQVAVSYRVTRVNGTVQDSATYTVKVSGAWSALPAPTMDTVQAGGVVNPGVIPASGATVRVRYDMRANDRVKVIWAGASRHETAEQTVVNQAELLFNLPKALITASEGAQAVLSYQVTRAGAVKESERRTLTVRSALKLDTSAVTLGGKVYLVPAHPDALPALPDGTTVQRAASGGTAPYTYSSSNTQVVAVNNAGLASVRGNGTASVTVKDATGQSLSYQVTVTGVIVCIGLGTGKWGDMSNAASRNGARLPSIHELREIHAMWGNQWPLVKNQHWSSTLAKLSPFGKTYYVKVLGSGGELDAYTYSLIPAIGIR
jgi:hypothetical protein